MLFAFASELKATARSLTRAAESRAADQAEILNSAATALWKAAGVLETKPPRKKRVYLSRKGFPPRPLPEV
jgi:hypothetical protein